MGVISKITIITVEMYGFEVLTRGLQVGTLRHSAPREIERNRTKFANLHKPPQISTNLQRKSTNPQGNFLNKPKNRSCILTYPILNGQGWFDVARIGQRQPEFR